MASSSNGQVRPQNERRGPLASVRVIELGQLLAGPFAGSRLADFGADVIKIEAPNRGDPMRDWGHARYNGRSLWWPVLSRNKRVITLDLRAERGQELFTQLVREADVLVENFRPGTLEGWGLGPERLHEVNPRLVIARVSGYGQTGPYANRAGFASVSEAMGGIRYINGYPDQPPPRTGISLGDMLAGMFAVEGILMALYWRDAIGGGKGQVIDAAITEACFAMLESSVPEYDKLGMVRGPSGTKLKGVAPSNIYRSRDAKWIVIAANMDTLFRRLCAVMGQPELAHDPRFATHVARGERQDELDDLIAAWAAEHDAAEIDRLLNEAGVVCGPIYSVADIFEDHHYQAREMLLRVPDPDFGELTVPGIVPKLSETPGAIAWLGPRDQGTHNREVFQDLVGLSAEEFDQLEREGVA